MSLSKVPKLKVFCPLGEYIASCKYAEDAIFLAQSRGLGANIRYDGHTKRTVVHLVTEENWHEIDANELWQRVEDDDYIKL